MALHRAGALAILMYSSILSAAYGGASPAAEATAHHETIAKPNSPIKTGIAGSFLSGRFARHNQDLGAAATYINASLEKDPKNLRLAQEALRLNLLAGDMERSITLAKQLAEHQENDPLIASLLMLDAVNHDDYARAKTVVTDVSSASLFGLIRPVMLGWIELGAGATSTPAALQTAIDKSGFFSSFLTYHRALMEDVLGHVPAAEAAYAKATADPGTTPYRVTEVYANFLARHGKTEAAQAAIHTYAKANPSTHLNLEKITANPAPLVTDARAGLSELFFTTASLLFSNDSAQDTFLYLRIAMALRPNLPHGQLMLATLYEQMEDYRQAITLYDTIHEDSVFYGRAQIRKALNYEALGDNPKALEILDAVARLYPDDAGALITKGDLLREAKQYGEAVNAYAGAISRSEPLTAADWPLLYARGISYERSGDWAHAETDFLRALTLEPNQPDVLNYLGYSWLTMNQNLAKAREYLETALAARPDDPHILDSIGWAHYLSGDYAKAISLLERTITLMPDDVTVNDHLGDAYWRIGRRTEARYQWERALTFKPEKESEAALKQKLANGLPGSETASPITADTGTKAM